MNLRPYTPNFWGVFLTPYPTVGVLGDPDAGYGAGWSFAEWQDQIDSSISIGANFIAYFGSIRVVALGTISLATYLDRRRQIVEYAYKKRIYVLSYGYSAITGVSDADAEAILSADAAMMAQCPNVIGYCTADEPWAAPGRTYAEIVASAASQYAAVKAVVPPDFPICCAPNPCGNIWPNPFDYTGANRTKCDDIAPYCDFFAFHPFATMTLASSAGVRAAYPNKDIIMPSSVLSENGDPDISSKAASIMGLVGANRFRGMGWFLHKDFESHTWGLFNNDNSPRTGKTNIFAANITGESYPKRSIRPYRGSPRKTALMNWGYR